MSARGAPASVIAATITTPPGGVHWLTREELIEWNVGGVTPAVVPPLRQAPEMGPLPISYRGWITIVMSLIVIAAYMGTRQNPGGLDLKPIRTDKQGNRI
jgi:hypothetical protein